MRTRPNNRGPSWGIRPRIFGVSLMSASATLLSASAFATLLICSLTPASALSMKDCSAKYKEAQTAGTLNGMKWNDFRKAQCGTDASAAATTPAPAAKPSAPAAAAKPTSTVATKPAPTAAAPSAATSPAVFPNAVSPKYSSESAGKARMHTCLDQYNTNKTTNANGGLNWIAKGGGYYSECNKRLKG